MNNPTFTWLKGFAATIVLLATSAVAMAAEGDRTYAVVSLVGDQLSVVRYQIATGSGIDRNLREAIPISDGLFDRSILGAIERALKESDGAAKVQLFAPTDASLFDRQDRFFDGDKLALPEGIYKALKSDGATHLVLITKQRAEARMQTASGKLGSGIVEGLGFYVDPVTPMISQSNLRQSKGFLSPYMFVRLTLVDLANAHIVRHETVTASSMMITADHDKAYHPWESLSPAEKLESLQDLIKQYLPPAITKLLAKG